MTDRYVAQYQSTTHVILEAMFAGGKCTQTTVSRIAAGLQTFALLVLAPCGLILATTVVFPDWARDVIGFLVFVSFLLGFGCLYLTNLIYRELAGITARSNFAREQEMILTPDGVTVRSSASTWFTSWEDVSAVLHTASSLCIVVGGIVLAAPKDAFENANVAFAHAKSWHNAAVFA